jgi:hypothetical protein
VRHDRIVELADALLELAGTIGDGRAAALAPRATGLGPAAPGDSYWVLDGRLLAGPYPGAPTRAEAEAKLDALLDAGVTCFVDLTEEGEGPPLYPYSALLRRRAAERGVRITHVRLPIRDVAVPTSSHMRALIGVIRLALAVGETVYVHCWGGVGRTGTVVGCLLIEDGAAPSDVLGELVRLRRHTRRAHRTSPDTEAQWAFVTAWRAAVEDATPDSSP